MIKAGHTLCPPPYGVNIFLNPPKAIRSAPGLRRADESPFDKMTENHARTLFGRERGRVECDFRMKRRLVRVVHTREVVNLAAPRPSVHALRVPPLAHLDGRVNEDFDETLDAHHAAHVVARRAVRTHGGADRDSFCRVGC